MSESPLLEGESLRAVEHRGSHVQIIASAGSGKTEVVSQRVVSLLAEGVAAREQPAITQAEAVVVEVAEKIKRREFDPSPAESRCGRCDVRSICAHSASKKVN